MARGGSDTHASRRTRAFVHNARAARVLRVVVEKARAYANAYVQITRIDWLMIITPNLNVSTRARA